MPHGPRPLPERARRRRPRLLPARGSAGCRVMGGAPDLALAPQGAAGVRHAPGSVRDWRETSSAWFVVRVVFVVMDE